MADETRQRILTLLQRGEMNVGELTNALGLTQPTISHHLALMRRAGLVLRRRQGRRTFYRADATCVAECCAGILTRFRIPVELGNQEVSARTATSKAGRRNLVERDPRDLGADVMGQPRTEGRRPS